MAALVAMLSATAGVAFWKITQARKTMPPASLIVLPEPRFIADFALTDHRGEAFSMADLRGNWSLIFFGFTHCPDVCPGALYELAQVKNTVDKKIPEGMQTPRILFISVDPERDSPEMLEAYLSHFDPTFIGVSGKHEQLLPLTQQVGIAYRIEEHESGATQYGVDHSTGILLTDPAGRLHGVFPAPHDAAKISTDLLAILSEADAS
jgi:protein SCO1/2